jgi:hypothetical protein
MPTTNNKITKCQISILIILILFLTSLLLTTNLLLLKTDNVVPNPSLTISHDGNNIIRTVPLVDTIRLFNVSFKLSLQTFSGFIILYPVPGKHLYFTARWIGSHIVGIDDFINNGNDSLIASFQLPSSTFSSTMTYQLSIISMIIHPTCLELNFDRRFIPPECNQSVSMRQEIAIDNNNLLIIILSQQPKQPNQLARFINQNSTPNIYWTFNPPELFSTKIVNYNKLQYSKYFMENIAPSITLMKHKINYTITDGRILTNYTCINHQQQQQNQPICFIGDSNSRILAAELMALTERNLLLRKLKLIKGYFYSTSNKTRWYSLRFPSDINGYFNDNNNSSISSSIDKEILECSVIILNVGLWILSQHVTNSLWVCPGCRQTEICCSSSIPFTYSVTRFTYAVKNLIQTIQHQFLTRNHHPIQIIWTSIENCPDDAYDEINPEKRTYHLKPFIQTFNVHLSNLMKELSIPVIDLFKIYDPVIETTSDFCHYTLYMAQAGLDVIMGKIFPSCIQ